MVSWFVVSDPRYYHKRRFVTALKRSLNGCRRSHWNLHLRQCIEKQNERVLQPLQGALEATLRSVNFDAPDSGSLLGF